MTAIAYPVALPGPQPGSFAPRERRAVSSIEGPLQQRARQRDAAGLASQYTYTYTPDEMAAWLVWYRDTLLDGRRWFAHALPGPNGLVQRVVRYRSVQQQLVGVGIYRVSASFEQRGAALMPATDDADPFAAFVLLLLHGDGANGSTVFTDSSSYNRSVTVGGGSPIISTAQSKFGGSSIFGGSGSNQLVTSRTGAEWAADNWTMECFYRRTGSGNYHGLLAAHNNLFVLLKTPINSGNFELLVSLDGDGLLNTTSVAVLDAWCHLACVVSKLGATYTVRLFFNGKLEASTTSTSENCSLRSGTPSLSIGKADQSGFAGFQGYLEEYRLTAAARYTADFIPPAAPFPDPP